MLSGDKRLWISTSSGRAFSFCRSRSSPASNVLLCRLLRLIILQKPDKSLLILLTSILAVGLTVATIYCCQLMHRRRNNTLTPEEMAARIAELEGRLAKSSTLRFKVSEKGAVSVYGLGRFR
jgi:hypothetical protein